MYHSTFEGNKFRLLLGLVYEVIYYLFASFSLSNLQCARLVCMHIMNNVSFRVKRIINRLTGLKIAQNEYLHVP